MEEVIRQFLAVSYGYGDGSGSGDGDCSGDGSGSGYGYYGSGSGYGSGDGSGSGYSDDGSGSGSGYGRCSGSGYGDDGYGDGSGDGVQSFNGENVYLIDNVQTIIRSVHCNYAKGFILKSDLTLTDCYIAKVGNFFAHGKTLREAMDDAQAKYDENRPLEERITDTIKKYPTLDTIVAHSELFTLHHVLTGSCLQGRQAFASDHNLDPEKGSMTMREFIELTKDAFDGDVIRQLAEAYGINI